MDYKQVVILLTVVATLSACVNFNQQMSDEVQNSNDSADVSRGRYLIKIMGCNDCHTSGTMSGSTIIPEEDWLIGATRGFLGSWGTVYPTNLRLRLNSMSEDDWLVLAKQMRHDSPMAWSWLPNATDQDLRTIHRFVKHLGPKGVPAPEPLPPGVKPTTDYIEFPLPH